MLAVDGDVLLAREVIVHRDLQHLVPGVGDRRSFGVYVRHRFRQGQIQIQHIVLFAGGDQVFDLRFPFGFGLLFHRERDGDDFASLRRSR